ncbi:MAG: hypothetical protein ACTSRF_15555 [Candidatus Freyarchaeota archaeon]
MNVSAENGTVTYLLVGDYPDEINGTKYTLIARVVGDEKIRVEAFEGHQEGKNFTENAKFYTRTGPLSHTLSSPFSSTESPESRWLRSR